MTIPLEEGFTVVTGPNGSGKSNILDGVLFCLGLANSKGMRADRLPDLVNSAVLRAGKSAETVVSVRFDLTDWQPDAAEQGLEPPSEGPWIKADQQEWTVTRRLRVMPGGSYSSSYSADGEPCNLQQLQTQLRRLRIDPEGSNVVMQGDVTRIVSMSNRDRRGLIDELAGVALFDNRIAQTRSKLDDVQERQERCRIVEQELVNSKQRLERDCAKARTYQELREKFQIGKKQELVLAYEAAKQGLIDTKERQKLLREQEIKDVASIKDFEQKISQSLEKFNCLQNEVKELGEDQLIAVQSEIAGLDTQTRELDRQALIHKESGEKLNERRRELINRKQEVFQNTQTKQEEVSLKVIEDANNSVQEAEAAVEVSRRRLSDVAGKSGAWVDDQRKRSLLRQKLQKDLNPLQNEQQKLEERLIQDSSRIKELESYEERDILEKDQVHKKLDTLESECKAIINKVESQKILLQNHLSELALQQKTRIRLEQEQTRLEREIAKVDSRRETLHESRGTGALRILLEAGIEGIHGPVAQLGEVEDYNRLALEVAAGARLGQIVVDDDRIAAKCIQLLKLRRAGRLTFLPLNKINSRLSSNQKALSRSREIELNKINGLIGKAINLIKFEPIYSSVFAYVFGETLVFTNLDSARSQLGLQRAVTIDGELLDRSGAMTGGSFSGRNIGFTFGRSNDGDESEPLKARLIEIGETLIKCLNEESKLQKYIDESRSLLTQIEQRQAALEAERKAAHHSNQPIIERRRENSERIQALKDTTHNNQKRFEEIKNELKPLIDQLKTLEAEENSKESHSEQNNWKLLQDNLEKADKELITARNQRDILINEQRHRELELERLEDQKNTLLLEEGRLKEEVNDLAKLHNDWRDQHKLLKLRRKELEHQQEDLQTRLGEQRRARDLAESELSNLRQKLQEIQWKLERLRQDCQSLEEEIRNSTIRLQKLEQSLPNPLPELSDELRLNGLEALQADLLQIQTRMEALEPVNMLALEELEQLEKRLEELEDRLNILSDERSELLLRIETVATLRQEAFMEAFQEVDKHFRDIFASLSEGDGHLQLDNNEDPLEGGLTLVAHPKGKAVRRLAAMSGGEKSLTALSFLFALQRFRPSPFYALDEVDSFLDGVNVERLSSLIARQAEQAQFLVVSHRRPMIAASVRTIGVTQARGAHTQVVGLPDAA